VTLERRKALEERRRAEELKTKVQYFHYYCSAIPTHPVRRISAWRKKSCPITTESWPFEKGRTLIYHLDFVGACILFYLNGESTYLKSSKNGTCSLRHPRPISQKENCMPNKHAADGI
jgi:hypothetical protein